MSDHVTETVLVVDDDATVRRLMKHALQTQRYRVLEADSGEQAIRMAIVEPPSLFLLDINMPGIDGYETCKRIKAHERLAGIPVIFASASTDADTQVRAFAAGANDYVTKPLHPGEVLARVDVHLRLHRTESVLREKNLQLERLAAELSDLSRVDSLTRVANRRAWMDALAKEQDRYQRHGNAYSVVVLDIDCFKAFNDSLGHLAGDECLRRVAAAISHACRKVDSVGRYGGEEFVVLLPETDINCAAVVAERVRRSIWSLAIPHPASMAAVRVTASVGVAGSRPNGSDDDVLKRADDAMYVAKRGGRNMVYSDFGTPRLDPQHAAARPAPACSVDQDEDHESARVLIVGRDADDRELARCALDQHGHDVRAAVDFPAAERICAEFSPEIIVCQIDADDGNGIELVRQLHGPAGFPNASLIAMGTLSDPHNVGALIQAGAGDCLIKPVTGIELALRIRATYRHRREHEDLLDSYQMRGDQMRILTRMVDYCRGITADWCFDGILAQTVDALANIALSRRVDVLLFDAEQGTFRLAATNADGAQPGTESAGLDAYPVAEAFNSNQTIVLNRADDGLADTLAGVPLLATPLATSGECLGVIRIGERAGGQPFAAYELEFVELVAGIAATSLQNARSIAAEMQASDAIMVALARLAEQRDICTGRHLDRVARYCRILAEQLGRNPKYRTVINPAFLHNLMRATPLHDIGKVGVPDDILLCPGKLTEQQMQQMRKHVVIGARLLESLMESAPGVAFLPMAADIARYHHEWWDGTGYAAGLAGEDIPLAARITTVADVYDALTTQRVYKPAMSHEQATAVIVEARGTQFDPEIVDAFIAALPEFSHTAEELADTELASPAVAMATGSASE